MPGTANFGPGGMIIRSVKWIVFAYLMDEEKNNIKLSGRENRNDGRLDGFNCNCFVACQNIIFQ